MQQQLNNTDFTIASHLSKALGSKTKLRHWITGDGKFHQYLLEAKNTPTNDLTSWATVGLSAFPLKDGSETLDWRAELIGCAQSSQEEMLNIIMSSAFEVAKMGWIPLPGTILLDAISPHFPQSEMKHLYVTLPVPWEEELSEFKVGKRRLGWFLLCPISEAEKNLAEKAGIEALETLLENDSVDIFDLTRPSSI